MNNIQITNPRFHLNSDFGNWDMEPGIYLIIEF